MVNLIGKTYMVHQSVPQVKILIWWIITQKSQVFGKEEFLCNVQLRRLINLVWKCKRSILKRWKRQNLIFKTECFQWQYFSLAPLTYLKTKKNISYKLKSNIKNGQVDMTLVKGVMVVRIKVIFSIILINSLIKNMTNLTTNIVSFLLQV